MESIGGPGGGAGYRFVDHTADVALELWAPDEAGLLLQGGLAITDLLTEGASIGSRDELQVQLTALDPEDRLVRWLNEILVLALTRGFLLAEATLALAPGRLDAQLRGEAGAQEKVKTEVKSATYHDLHVSCAAGGLAARVVIDV